MNKLFVLVGLLLTFVVAQAQTSRTTNNKQINTVYSNAVALFERNELFEANVEFEKVVKLNPNHRDALYNLALINEQLGDSPSAIRFLLRGVKLNDKRSSQRLVDKFQYKLSYADTMQNIDMATKEKYLEIQTERVASLNDLTNRIISKTANKREQLQILLLWFFDNMRVDSTRFFQGGDPLSDSEAFTRRIGLCDEYSSIMSQFCKTANIRNYKVVGYVKYSNFNPGDPFTEANHAWNAVYLDSSWVLCDLFWSTLALGADEPEPHFLKRLETDYFLGHPNDFIRDHLPADPVFQLSNYPIVVSSFTKRLEGIDTTIPKMNYVNYRDSLDRLSKMSESDRLLTIAQHSYDYNRDNPNDMVVESYNYSVDIINKKVATRQELARARKTLTKALAIIDTSGDEAVRSLKSNCKTGIVMIDKRLAVIK